MDDCEVWELCRRAMTGRVFFLAAIEATNPPFFLLLAGVGFFSGFTVCDAGDGGRTTTCVFGLTDELGSASPSESGGEMNRAVGRGPDVDGPLAFFKMGWGIGGGALDVTEEDAVVLGRGWPWPDW